MRGNTKALTDSELKFLVGRYIFELVENYVVVNCNNKKTIHPRDEGFSLLLPLQRRRIKITKQAIDLWCENYIDKYSLLEVQNAINTLLVTFQSISEVNVKSQLERTRSKLDNLYREGE